MFACFRHSIQVCACLRSTNFDSMSVLIALWLDKPLTQHVGHSQPEHSPALSCVLDDLIPSILHSFKMRYEVYLAWHCIISYLFICIQAVLHRPQTMITVNLTPSIWVVSCISCISFPSHLAPQLPPVAPLGPALPFQCPKPLACPWCLSITALSCYHRPSAVWTPQLQASSAYTLCTMKTHEVWRQNLKLNRETTHWNLE